MRILLAIDGSNCSKAAIEEVARRPWPRESRIRILSVIETPFVPERQNFNSEYSESAEKSARTRTQALIDNAVATIVNAQGNGAPIMTAKILEGSPKQNILDESERWKADLIIVGSHRYSRPERVFLGSVSQVISMHAACSVEIVRRRDERSTNVQSADKESAEMSTEEITRKS